MHLPKLPQPSTRRPITVSIVSHGQLEMVLPLLRQLEASSRAVIDKIVLTHNRPEPDLLAGTDLQLPIERLFNAKPMGFGANHNQAFERCASDWFLVLNPDIRLESDVLGQLLAQAQPKSGLLTPRIFEPGRPEPEPHRAIITPVEILTRNRPGYRRPDKPAWIPGLFMLFRAQAYRQIGGFDQQRFFMCGEDFDICARTCMAGWEIQVVESLHAVHEAQRASHASRRHLYWHVSSLLKVWTSKTFWRYRQAKAYGSFNG